MMTAYNKYEEPIVVRSVPDQQILKGEWGFKGIVIPISFSVSMMELAQR